MTDQRAWEHATSEAWSTEAAVVLRWHAALNAEALDDLAAVSLDTIEVGGPRGVATGRQALIDWATRAGIRLTPSRVIERGETVIVEQEARWPTDAAVHRVASVFRVRDGLVAEVLRYPDLDSALAAAGVSRSAADGGRPPRRHVAPVHCDANVTVRVTRCAADVTPCVTVAVVRGCWA